MPFDFYADFVKRTAFTPLAHVFAQKLVVRHPRLRFRLRQPDALDVPPLAVAEPLRAKVEIPEPAKYWVMSYTCEDCKGNVAHGQRLLHLSKGHKLVPGNISHRGLRYSWRHSGFAVVLAEAPKPLKTYSFAITAPGGDPVALSAFDVVFLLQLYQDRDAEAFKARIPKAEVIVLPRPFDEAVDAFVARYCQTDLTALDPLQSPEELELAEQEKRFVSARGYLSAEIPKAMAVQQKVK